MVFKKAALIIHNPQIDYCTGGAMEVPKGEKVLPIIGNLLDKFEHKIAVLDWHPANHVSFAGNHPWRHIGQTLQLNGIAQKLLPFHCVEHSFGAQLHPSFPKEQITHQVKMGTKADIDDYSCFQDADKNHNTGLQSYLEKKNIQHLFFAGLPLEHQLKNSVLDALALGYKTVIIKDACRGYQEVEKRQLLTSLEKRGAVIINTLAML